MELARIFLNRWGRPRSGWRLLVFLVINFFLTRVFFLAVLLGYSFLAALRPPSLAGRWGWIIQALVLLGAGTAAGVCLRVMRAYRPARGWTWHRGWLEWLKGSSIGALSLVCSLIVLSTAATDSLCDRGDETAVFNTL